MPGLSLSPSLLHRALADGLRPSHAFDGGDVAAWQSALRVELRRLLGMQHLPEPRPELRARELWRRDLGFGSVEKIAFESEPGSDVVAYLAKPVGFAPPHPVMICLQGHTSGMHNSLGLSADETRVVEVEGARDFARQALERGWAALCIEQRSLGERRETLQARVNLHNSCHDAAMHALLLGRTLLGERIYDVARGLELVSSRPELDARRVGITGNSGGGTVAIWAAALIEQIGFAMPSCSLCTFRDSIMSIYHCADNYVPGVLRVAEMADIAGLIAPRPLLAVTGAKDEIFPLPGVRACFEAVQRIYRALGAEAAIALRIGPEGHRFYPELAWPKAEELLGQNRGSRQVSGTERP